ncbi:MAG: hypothetical protein LBR43_03350 [Spiroplasmataceae bacterium]|jgi:hypothetical protein|nr:hypothetical protein [Spiroplasmataceae bacterium]
MLKVGFSNNKNKNIVNWDKEAIASGGFNQGQWNQVRSNIDNNLASLTPEFLIKGGYLKSKRVKQAPNLLTRHGIHKDNNYFQVYYREKLLKEQMKLRGWTPINQLNNNYLALALKKTDENNHKYIYNFLNFTRINQSDFEGKNSWYTLFKKE